MATFISIPLKKTSEVDLIKPLKHLISSYYSTADEPVDCTDALNELNKLRMNSTWRTLDKHDSSLEVMCRYYDQLTSLESKCPPHDVQIPFKWRDAFDKGSFFGGSTNLTLSSLTYEKICILFNIAAMQSQIAASQFTDLRNDDAIRSAAKHLQQSSGIFTHLKNSVMSCIQQDPTPDLHPDTLSALAALMLAQAQETFFYKATAGQMKNTVIAKVASQCEQLYADALKQMQKDNLRVLWEKDYISNVAGKQAAFHSISEYHQALVCKEKKEIGEQLARLKHAQDLMKSAENRAGVTFAFKDYLGHINREYEETKKDNDFIYHARVLDIKSLTPVGKAALAKPLPLPEKLSTNFTDLFSNLLPVPVQQALQSFDVRKTEILNNDIGSLREQTQMMNGVLASLNLPAALEDTCGNSLPQSIKDKAIAIKDKGGIAAIEKLITELPIALERNKEVLDEAERIMSEEQQSDEQLRSQFKEKWTRTPSSKLNEPLRSQCDKYRQIINNAISADAIVKEKYSKHRDKIELLSKSEAEIQSAIPSGGSVVSSNSSSAAQRLKALMEQVDAIRAEREVIESELKGATIDMKPKFLDALAKDGAISEQALSVESLGEVFGPLQKQIRESISKQEALMAEIQNVNTEFCRERSGDGGSIKRANVLSELASAYDAYMELTANLQEGTKFYNDLTQLLVNFQNKISDFCFARKTEKDELCRDLQQNIVKQASQPTPTPPDHHTATSKQSAPPRPPPPPPSVPQQTFQPTTNPQPVPGAPQPVPVQAPPYPIYSYPTAVPMPTAYNPYTQPVLPSYPQGYQQQPLSNINYPYPQQQAQPQPYPYPYSQPQPHPQYPQYPQQRWQ